MTHPYRLRRSLASRATLPADALPPLPAAPSPTLSSLTFAPASRADLLALRTTIDRALAAPGEVQTCAGCFGGAVVRLSLAAGKDVLGSS